MCGIVGYVGPRAAAPILLDGLFRLEYRGYDSAGLALLSEDGHFWSRKTAGRVAELERVAGDPPSSRAGIAHTRWATHGGVTNENAHPHFDEARLVMVVHNGIIDNADTLKARLLEQGVKFTSETDTEVIAHLIARAYAGDPRLAVTSALRQLEGTYGLAVMFADRPDLIVAARLGSPLVIGVGDDESILASDPQAIVAHTRRVVYMNDREIACITPSAVDIRKLDGGLSLAAFEVLGEHYEAAELGNFPHFMLKEICEQPESVERCLAGRLRPDVGGALLGGMNLSPKNLAALRSVVPIGCGTAYFAGMATSMVIEALSRLPSRPELAADFRSRHAVVPADSLYLAFSQSGETADTIGAVQEILTKGGEVAGVVNVVGSTLARLCGRGVYVHAGPEAAVASTKAFTAQIAAGCLFALMLARTRLLSESEGREICRQINQAPQAMRRYLADVGPVKEAAEFMASRPYVLFMGRGYSYPVALEGALKFKELAYVPCEGYHAGEMKHGPIAMLQPNTPVVVVVPSDFQRERTIANMKEAQARGASLIVIHTEGDAELMDLASIAISVPRVPEIISPLVTALPIQLLSYYGALAVGADVDKPRNLAKSVTVE